MLHHYLFQPVQVQEHVGLVVSVAVLSCTVWLPGQGNVVLPTQSLHFIQDPALRPLVAGVLARLPNCPVQFSR
jgi:hypothetical protein